MSGGYGGRGANDGPGYSGRGYDEPGYGEPGYGEQDRGEQGYDGQGYDEQGYDGPGYGGRGRPRRRPGAQQPGDGPGAPGGRPGRPGQPRGYPGQGPGQPPGRDPGYGPPYGRDQEYGRQGGRPDPWAQGPRQPGGGDAPRYPRGGQQPAPRDADPPRAGGGSTPQGAYGPGPRRPRPGADPAWQPQGGYDPRGATPGRASDGYPGESYPGEAYPGGYQGRSGSQGWGGDAVPEPGFVPGFGQGGDYDEGRRHQGEPVGYPGYENVDDRRGRRGRRGRDDDRGGGGGGGDWDDGGGAGRRRGAIRRLAPWIALLVILTPILVGGLYVYHIYENKYHPADYSGPGTGSVTVEVNSGDTAFSLGPRLQSLGVVASSRAFELAAERTTSATGVAPGLEAGFYKLHMHMQASLAWAALLNPKDRVQLTVTIPEGKRASQVALILAKETSIPASQFQAVLGNPAQLGLPSYANGKVEGYLFPATYTIEPNETATQILKAMVARFNVEAQAVNLSSAARKVHLSAAQVIIEASLAQAEGGSVADYPKIARVISNRLKVGMHLQFDSTVLYGLGKYAVSATIAQTRTPGPYNTYLNAGLPPGPISNPGDSAIQAILHPASGNWLYFLTKPGGQSEFSATPLAGQ